MGCGAGAKGDDDAGCGAKGDMGDGWETKPAAAATGAMGIVPGVVPGGALVEGAAGPSALAEKTFLHLLQRMRIAPCASVASAM